MDANGRQPRGDRFFGPSAGDDRWGPPSHAGFPVQGQNPEAVNYAGIFGSHPTASLPFNLPVDRDVGQPPPYDRPPLIGVQRPDLPLSSGFTHGSLLSASLHAQPGPPPPPAPPPQPSQPSQPGLVGGVMSVAELEAALSRSSDNGPAAPSQFGSMPQSAESRAGPVDVGWPDEKEISPARSPQATPSQRSGPLVGREGADGSGMTATDRARPDRRGGWVPGRRHMESLSMTDREIEMVLKMHMKLLETSDEYHDDYYFFVFSQELPSDTARVTFESPVISRPGGGSSNRNTPKTRVEDKTKKPLEHTTKNLRALANALGTVQSWTPSAPKRVVNIKAAEEKDGPVLLKEDERVGIRALIEDGYDTLALLYDKRRNRTDRAGKGSDMTEEDLVSKLYGILEPDGGSDLLVRICALAKGKRFMVKCLEVFSQQQQLSALLSLVHGLSLLCDRALYRGREYEESEAFWAALVEIAEDAPPFTYLESALLQFVSHQGVAEIVAVLASLYGGQLIYTLLERAYVEGAATTNSPDWLEAFAALCEAVLQSLGDIFERSENTGQVWRLVAILDELGKSQPQRKRLRALLKQLLEEGRAPPPPTT